MGAGPLSWIQEILKIFVSSFGCEVPCTSPFAVTQQRISAAFQEFSRGVGATKPGSFHERGNSLLAACVWVCSRIEQRTQTGNLLRSIVHWLCHDAMQGCASSLIGKFCRSAMRKE